MSSCTSLMTTAGRDGRMSIFSARGQDGLQLGSLHRSYSLADGVVDQLSQGMETKLEHDPSAVPLDGPDSDLQKRSDLLVGFSFRQEADDLRLARRCPGTRALLLLTLAFGLRGSFHQ